MPTPPPTPDTGKRESSLLRRAWLELRFIGHAALQRGFDDPRVQVIVKEKLRG